MIPSILVRVQSVRSQNPNGLGGCIFTGIEISEIGDVVDAKSYFVIKATGWQLGDCQVQTGQWWRVSGEEEIFERSVNGYRIHERQLNATQISLARLSGEHVVTFMAECGDFQGIGMVKARKLWATFGEDLYRLLDNGEIGPLSKVLTVDGAKQIVNAWSLQGKTQTLQWLQNSEIDVRVGRKLIAYFGADAQSKLTEDPYRLLSFAATWKQVDALARGHFKVADDDPRRLQGAIEEALYRVLGDGHTRAHRFHIVLRLGRLLGRPCDYLARDALESGLSNGSFVVGKDGSFHPIGAWVMETSVARALKSRLSDPNKFTCLHPAHIDSILADYELNERITLNDEQRLAVHVAAANAVSLIIGGAGVGKTTVLKALYRVFDETRTQIFQMALAGRAAKRMLEATGRPASTIASFLKAVKEGELAGRCVIVVDEASMVDIITMNRLCEMLPDHVRIVLAGDTAQLMPVGPGLVLHAMARIPQIPKVELKVVKRYGSAIALAAQAVRGGVWPAFSDNRHSPISFITCRPKAIAEVVVKLFAADMENTQILSPRRSSLDGTEAINALVQSKFTRAARPLLVYSEEFQLMAGTGFYLGDKILCTRNLWEWGLQNGSLGRLIEIEDAPRRLTNADGVEIGHAIGWVLWDDGEHRPILESMLDDLELGNAITVHKAQGSQWPRLIVVLTGSKMLDRTLIYTAMTRAQQQVILIGDPVAARSAVESLPRADTRMVGLDMLLQEHLGDIRTNEESVPYGHPAVPVRAVLY
ncbi:ATP-dependent DNA helicase [Massilia sp. TWR1-2-2]|uniref:ATP-dependent DNA helicase n=1 Tax=Massilia sp. TWR1-2-2 TaxID=2804584 RepID=UPI003CF3CEF6